MAIATNITNPPSSVLLESRYSWCGSPPLVGASNVGQATKVGIITL